jgi:hypothetical protein
VIELERQVRAIKNATEWVAFFVTWWRMVDHVPTGLPSLRALVRVAAGFRELSGVSG